MHNYVNLCFVYKARELRKGEELDIALVTSLTSVIAYSLCLLWRNRIDYVYRNYQTA